MLQRNLPQVMSRQFIRNIQISLRSSSASADRLKVSSDIMRLCSTRIFMTLGGVESRLCRRDLGQRLSSKSNVAYQAVGILS
jgi:hypothetical protein